MVEWSAFGERPPLSREDWQREFEKYKQFPEYKQYWQLHNILLDYETQFRFLFQTETGHHTGRIQIHLAYGIWSQDVGQAYWDCICCPSRYILEKRLI